MSARPLPKPTSVLAAAWIAVPLLLIGCSAFLTFRSQRALMDTVATLDRGFDVRQRIRQFYISLLDAETGQRGFLLTSREAYLAPYEEALERLPRQIEQLGAMEANDPDQQKCLQQLRVLMTDKLGEMGRTIRYARAGDLASAVALVKSDEGMVEMDKIRLLVRQMRINCDRTLAVSEDAYLSQSRQNTRLALVLVVANGIFFAFAAVLLRRIRRMESLVTVCAWSHTIEYEGSWMSFEKYLKVRFGLETTHGISPAQAEKFNKPADPAAKRGV
jgi:CHASE3 domain sensor protein